MKQKTRKPDNPQQSNAFVKKGREIWGSAGIK
jgi:hypothetical protein